MSLSANSLKLADSSVILTSNLPSRMFMTGEIMLPHQWARRRFATCLDAAGCAAGATVAAADAAAGFSVGGAGVGAAGVADEQASRRLAAAAAQLARTVRRLNVREIIVPLPSLCGAMLGGRQTSRPARGLAQPERMRSRSARLLAGRPHLLLDAL